MRTTTIEEAVAGIPNGASLMMGGFMGVGTPERLVDELIRQGKRDLTVIANDTALPGIGIGVASAVLALSEPEQYAIIDWRGWRQAFGTGRESFGCKHYCEYMRVVRSAAKQLGWQPQVVDWCLWNLDRAA